MGSYYVSDITPEMLSMLDLKDLDSLRIAHRSIAEPRPKVKAWFEANRQYKEGPFAASDLKVIDEFRRKKAEGGLLHLANLEKGAWDNNQTIQVEARTLVVTSVDNKRTVLVRSAVPMVAPRRGAYRLIVFLSAFWHIDKGELKEIMNFNDFKVRFTSSVCTVDPNGLEYVLRSWKAVLAKHPLYESIVSESKTLKGIQFIDLVVSVIQSCDWLDYLALHDVVCTRFLRVLHTEIVGLRNQERMHVLGRLSVINDKGEQVDMVPETSVTVLTPDDLGDNPKAEIVDAITKFYNRAEHWPCLLTGDIFTRHKFPSLSDDISFKFAVGVATAAATLRGSPYEGTGVFLQNMGFFSISNSGYNEIRLLVALALNAHRHYLATKVKTKVGIYLTTGQVDMVNSTLTKWMGGDKERLERFYYILSSDSISNVNTRHSLSVEPSPTPGSHVIKVFMTNPPGISTSIDPTSHYLDATLKMLKSMSGASSFTIYCPIMHDLMFGVVDDVSEQALKTNNIVFSMPKCRVHEFREPFDCRAIVTDLGEVHFPGDKHFGEKRLDKIETLKDWVSKVLNANAMANLYFLRPISFGTCLANILVPPVNTVSEWRKDSSNFVGQQGFDSIYSSEAQDQVSAVFRPLSKSGEVPPPPPPLKKGVLSRPFGPQPMREKQKIPKGIVPLKTMSRGGKPPTGMVFAPKMVQGPPPGSDTKSELSALDPFDVKVDIPSVTDVNLGSSTTTIDTPKEDLSALLNEALKEGERIEFEGDFI